MGNVLSMDFATNTFDIDKFDYETQLHADKEKRQLIQSDFNKEFLKEKANTIWEIFEKSVESHSNNGFIGRRYLKNGNELSDFVFRSYSETNERIKIISNALNILCDQLTPYELDYSGDDIINEGETAAERNYSKDEKNCVAIYSVNRPEWMEICLSAHSVGFKVVPLYDTFGIKSIQHIIERVGLRIIACSKDKVSKLLETKRNGLKSLEVIIQFDRDDFYNVSGEEIDPIYKTAAEELGVKLMGYSELLETGRNGLEAFVPARPQPEDLAYIMFTSGTSGTPKGVMLTHSNAVSSLRSATTEVKFDGSGSLLSFLPLAHIFECILEGICIIAGARIGYFSGSIKDLAEDIKVLKPTYFAAVPRVIEKLCDKIFQQAASAPFFKRLIFKNALSWGVNQTHHSDTLTAPKPLDGLVWKKIREKAGFDNLEVFVTGGAPCPPRFIEFLRVLLKADIIQGYGLTETYALICLTQLKDPNLGHVGLPISCEIKLEAVPDTDYSPEDDPPRGEILVKGANVFKGYFRDEKRTRDVMEDGWFRTGDVGRINHNGTISIIDRRKDLFKLSQGEYVSPEVLEREYSQSEAVNQIFVYGDSTQTRPVAIVVPSVMWAIRSIEEVDQDKKKLEDLKAKALAGNMREVVEEYKELGRRYREMLSGCVLETMKSKEERLNRYERIEKLWLEFEVDEALNGFNVENDCLTPSFKMKRSIIKKRYEEIIKKMYLAKEGVN